MLKKKKNKKNKDGELEDEEDEVMMAQMAAKGAGTLQYTKPPDQPLLEIEAKPDPQESEEWQKFNALLNKSQATVAITQTKMNKLADTSVTTNKTTSSSTPGPAPSWTGFDPEPEQQPPSEEQSAPEVVEPAAQEPPAAYHAVPDAPLEPAQIRTPSPEPAAVTIHSSSSHDSSIRTPIENTVMASSAISTGTVVERSATPPTAAIARARPKGSSEITLAMPAIPPAAPVAAPAAAAAAPSPSSTPFNVPDVFDTSKFLDDAPAGASGDGGSDNPFNAMFEDSSKHVDLGAEDFFSKLSNRGTAATESWAAGGGFLNVPKPFDALQTYTDDEGAAAEASGAEGDGAFSSANNPFRGTAGGASGGDAFGASDDPFASLANMGGGSSTAAAGGGAEWDEFDPFCEKSKQSSEQAGGAFTANFGKGAASGKRSQMDKERRKDSQGSSGSQDSAGYDEYDENEVLEPLAPFHSNYTGQWFQMGLRQPPKKSKMPFTGQRGWRTTYARIESDPKTQQVFVKLYLTEKDAAISRNPLHEVKLDPYMTLSEIGMQPFDEYGKVYTTKIYRTDYKERPALRPDKLTPKGLTLTSIKDLKRLITKPKATMILDHAPQHDELMKLGCLNYEELKQFRWYFEDAMMRVITKRQQTSQQYTKDEIIAEIIDEYEAQVDKYGHITEQKARVRIYCLSFLSGMAFVEFGVNDLRRKGKEVVRRQDIIPMRTEQWIRIEDYQFHCCVNVEEFNKSTVIRFQPPDGINVEILRFRVRPRKNFQLPLQVRAVMNVDKTNREVEIRMEVLIPGYFSNSRKANQAPCENISISFPIPEPWIYYFRVEHVWGIGSVHAHKARPGKVKGLDRITNMAEGLIPKSTNATGCQMEVNTGDCKYEHLLNGLVWRIPRLPERFQGAYKTHLMSVRIPLGAHDPIPETFEKFVTVNYVMPATAVSRAMIRSISSTSQADEPPDKWVKQLARFYYKVEVEYTYEVHSKGDTVEKPQTVELPTTLVPGEKLTLSAQPSAANPPEQGEGAVEEKAPRMAGLAVSDEDSSDEEALAKKKTQAAAAAASATAGAVGGAAAAQASGESDRPAGLKVSDESDESDEDEDEKPKFKIQLNPVIQSFIEKGGAMMNGAMKKKQAEQQAQQQQHNEPPRPPPPHHHSEPPKRPQSPGEQDAGSEASDDDLHEHGKEQHPKRPPPPRPAAPHGPPVASPPGGKKWTVIAEADSQPKHDSDS